MVIFGTSREEAAEVKEGEPASAEAEEGLAEASPEGEAAGLAEGSPAGLSKLQRTLAAFRVSKF